MIGYHTIATFLEIVAFLFQLGGILALIAGTITALVRFFYAMRKKMKYSLDQLRLHIGQSIVLGMEFLVAGDIVKTIVTPDYYDIGMLAILVIIRTLITYFLNQELSHLNKGV